MKFKHLSSITLSVFIAIFFLVPFHNNAQAFVTSSVAALSVDSIVPSSNVTTSTTVSGSGQGGSTQDEFPVAGCDPGIPALPATAHTLDTPQYQIDSGVMNGFSMTITQGGINQPADCLPPGGSSIYQPYTYSYSFLVNTTGLSSGVHTVTVYAWDPSTGFTISASGTFSVTGPMSGTLTASNCTIASGASFCTTTLNWTTTNPVATSAVTTPKSITAGSGNSGTATSFLVTNGNGRIYYLYNNAVLLAQAAPTGTCAAGTVWNGSTCAPGMTGTLTASNCTILSGGSTCSSTLNWTTTNPVATSSVTTPTNITAGSGNSGSSTYSITNGSGIIFYLYNNAVLLTQVAPTGTCAAGTSWLGGVCTPNINGGWSAWSACAGGLQTRTCTNPSPSGTGLLCTDPTNPNYDGGGASQSCAAATNGVCATTHYNCTVPAGVGTGGVSNISSWTWSCPGSNGGTTASCTELKKKPAFIEN
ncbi:MAG: hypothetical protein KGL67_00270 [Patescibacteria group bacterium]|nr:hypothetical protein [Patescibacteria group bacterium]